MRSVYWNLFGILLQKNSLCDIYYVGKAGRSQELRKLEIDEKMKSEDINKSL
jgi:hypothetical protein